MDRFDLPTVGAHCRNRRLFRSSFASDSSDGEDFVIDAGII